jgi:hypothetical protein
MQDHDTKGIAVGQASNWETKSGMQVVYHGAGCQVGKALARDQNTRIVIEKSIFRQSIVDAFFDDQDAFGGNRMDGKVALGCWFEPITGNRRALDGLEPVRPE